MIININYNKNKMYENKKGLNYVNKLLNNLSLYYRIKENDININVSKNIYNLYDINIKINNLFIYDIKIKNITNNNLNNILNNLNI